MRIIQTVVVIATSLAIGACCCGGKKASTETSGGAATTTAKTSDIKMADPSKIKAVKKVAVVSVNAECDIKNETEKGGVWAAAGAVSAMKNQDATRTPMMLDLAAPKFAEELAASTGWTVMPFAEMTANPAYEQNTFPADLREQVKVTRRPLGCAGAGYRVLTRDYTAEAGKLATALGVDAVVIAQFVMTLKYDSLGVNATGVIWTNGNVSIVGPDGSMLYKDLLNARSDETIPMKAGKLDWTLVPPLGPSALKNAAKTFGDELKKKTAT